MSKTMPKRVPTRKAGGNPGVKTSPRISGNHPRPLLASRLRDELRLLVESR
jgi:hypothetical protein